MVAKVKDAGSAVGKVADKAKGPALAVGAAAAAVAGGVAIAARRPKRVLGMPVPRAISKVALDPKKVGKQIGKASKQLGQTSKSVSKDIERVGEQAERIGKILS